MELFLTLSQILVLLFSVTVHEVSHGAMAEKQGDQTARLAGRMTLNPLKHLDPFGSVILPLIMFLLPTRFMFGWAKPVPVNPSNFRDLKYGQTKVALAGPLSNLALSLFFGLLLRFVPFGDGLFWQNIQQVFIFIVLINLVLAIFNLTPIPPFDGSHVLFTFLPPKFERIKQALFQFSFFIIIFYIFFIFPFVMRLVGFIFQLLTGLPFSG